MKLPQRNPSRFLRNRLKSCGYWSVAPKAIDVHLVKNEIAPTSMGEPPYPRIFGVLANALYKATWNRGHRRVKEKLC